MSEEIARLTVGVEGDKRALTSLQSLDKLVKRLNETPISIKIDTNLSTATLAVQKNVEAVNQNIAANAALIQSGNALAAAELKNAQELSKGTDALQGNINLTDKMIQKQQGLVAAMEAEAQAQAKQAAAAIQAQAAVMQEANAKEKLIKVEINIAESAEQVAEANIKELNAKAKLIKAESALAVAREKSYQESQKTQQAIERTTQAELRQSTAAMQQAVSEQERMRRGFNAIGSQVYRLLVQNVQKATTELKAVNSEMVSIQKVTGATDAEMARLKDNAFGVASALGSTPLLRKFSLKIA